MTEECRRLQKNALSNLYLRSEGEIAGFAAAPELDCLILRAIGRYDGLWHRSYDGRIIGYPIVVPWYSRDDMDAFWLFRHAYGMFGDLWIVCGDVDGVGPSFRVCVGGRQEYGEFPIATCRAFLLALWDQLHREHPNGIPVDEDEIRFLGSDVARKGIT